MENFSGLPLAHSFKSKAPLSQDIFLSHIIPLGKKSERKM